MICIAWCGFPYYAARCVAAFVNSTSERVVVIGTTPDVPIRGMEAAAECEVVWVKETDCCSLKSVCGELPRVIMISGWALPLFNRWRDEVHVGGGRVLAMVDNNFIFSFKEMLRAVRFRLQLCNKYDGFIVPGKSGLRLLQFYGVDRTRVYTGLYAADAAIFHNGPRLASRLKRILFVGRLIEHKNILPLCRAFLSIGESIRKDWKLEICGSGSLRNQIPQHEAIDIHDFVQPEELAKIYCAARIFVLPSLCDHWGLVVHEAALSGCVLVLSKQVGAGEDLLGGHNGFSFDAFNHDELKAALKSAMSMSDAQLDVAQKESVSLAQAFSPALFASELQCFIDDTLEGARR